MFTVPRTSFFALCTLLLGLLIGTGPAVAQTGSSYSLEVTRAPFSYAFTAADQGEALVRQHRPDTARSSLYFVTEEGTQYLSEPISFSKRAHTLKARYRTTDGREATVRITPRAAEGGWAVSVQFSPTDGIERVGEVLAARSGEHFHGLTERARGNDDEVPRDSSVSVALDRRGHRVKMDLNGTISLYAPFYLSSAGYGLYVEGTHLGVFDVAQTDDERIQFAFDGSSLSYRIFDGTPKEILNQYTGVVGRPSIPPEWAFGTWRWRDNHTNRDTLYDGTPDRSPYNSMAYEDVVMMDSLDIPLDVYWVDRPWAKGPYGYDDFEWDPERFPNAESMIDWVREEHGAEFLVWVAPWVMGDMAEEALKKGYVLPSKGMVEMGLKEITAEKMQDAEFLRQFKPAILDEVEELNDGALEYRTDVYFDQEIGGPRAAELTPEEVRAAFRDSIRSATTAEEIRPFLNIDDRAYTMIDFTNPEAVDWWQDYVARLLEDDVAAFKLDRAEEFVPDARDAYAHDGRSMAEVQNEYPVLYAKAVKEVVQKHREDFVVMPRAGYPGSQRYANAFWAGDTRATWLGFRNTLIAGLRSAVIGYPIWGSDTGGYWGGTTTQELLSRWLGMSAFSPVMEVGPINDQAPWDMPDGTGYNAEAIATWRMYSLLHKHLQDYSIRYAEEARDTGHPIMRPLFVEYPDDEQAWERWDEYLYGEDYLVAPVLEKGATEREVYLPEGRWIDYWNPDESPVEGPTTVTVETPVYKTPIFLRADSDQEILDLDQIYEESLEIARDQPTLPDGSQLESNY
jgi:alpha-glucosidase (family GH31 glycosyl hydrolase)